MGAQYNIGTAYYYGYGVKLDKKKALKYFKESAKQGYDVAQFNIGIMYMTGEGVERDVEEAQKRWALAAAQGHQVAQENLAVLQSKNARR